MTISPDGKQDAPYELTAVEQEGRTIVAGGTFPGAGGDSSFRAVLGYSTEQKAAAGMEKLGDSVASIPGIKFSRFPQEDGRGQQDMKRKLIKGILCYKVAAPEQRDENLGNETKTNKNETILLEMKRKSERMTGMENKEEIIMRLKLLLMATREGSGIADLILNEGQDKVAIRFRGGWTRIVNIECDSGIAIIKDVIKSL